MREVVFNLADIEFFDQDISPGDYEFFKKHTGAFKRMLEDQSKEKKKEFVDKFKTFAINNGCMKGCPSKNENRLYFDEAIAQYDENFVNGKPSTAKSIVMDAVILAQNRHNLQYMGANSYTKDPFFHKETRDTFRRLFGQPSEKGTCLKVVCVLPLHIKFGGAICRYLRRWMDAPVRPQLSNVASTKSSADKPPKATTKSTKKKEDREVKKMAYTAEEEFNYQFRKLLDYHPRNYGFDDDFPLFEKPLVVEDKNTKKKAGVDDTKRDGQGETLSLSEYFGILSKNNSETSSGGKMEGTKSCEPLEPSEDEDDENEGDKTPLSYEEVREMFLLGKPHPNEEYEQRFEKSLSEESALKLKKCKEFIRESREYKPEDKKSSSGDPETLPGEKPKKRHACANCCKVEPEPKTFKKCQRCHGKRTRFYCSRQCQEDDWFYRHRDDHNSIEDVT